MEKKTRTIEGWIKRSNELKPDRAGTITLVVCDRKGIEKEWFPGNWPPRKVKLIVEEP